LATSMLTTYEGCTRTVFLGGVILSVIGLKGRVR